MAAPAIVSDEEELTPEQLLYRAEKARRAERVRPEMIAAAAELQRLEELAREQGKGGRPKGSGMTLGKNARPRGRAAEPEPEAPGRPEWLPGFESRPPSLDEPPPRPRPTTTTMPETRLATECGHKTPKRAGPAPKLCDDCKGKKPEKAEKPRRMVNTGFRGEPPSTLAAPSSGLSGAIEAIKEELNTLDARRAELREQLRDALESLQELANA